jgi:transposase
VLLRNEKDLNERQREKLIEVGKVSPKLATMYRLKEEFREIFESSENWAGGTLRLLDWMADSSTFFRQSCGTIKRWIDEVTSYFELRITNGVVEGINNKLKLIKRLGYGFMAVPRRSRYTSIWEVIEGKRFGQLTCTSCE